MNLISQFFNINLGCWRDQPIVDGTTYFNEALTLLKRPNIALLRMFKKIWEH